MEKIEKLTALLQGTLDEESERKLFAELAINDEYRNDFNNLASISDSIKRNLDSFAPSSALKSRIFAKAGFQMPVEHIVEAGSNILKSSFFKSKLFTGIASSLATAIIAFILWQFFFIPDNKALNQNMATSDKSTISQLNNIPKIENKEQESVKSNSKPIIKYIYIIQKEEQENNSNSTISDKLSRDDALNSLTSSIKTIIHNDIPNHNRFQNFNNHANSTVIFIPKNISLLNPIFGSEKKLGLALELRSSANWNFPQETISPASYSKFNNLDISLLYKLSEYFKIGADFEQETFYTVYRGREADGSLYRYRQQPNFSTISANIRYYPLSLYSMNPYAQLGMGINQGGYVIKPSAGVEFQVGNSVSFIIGLEYNKFWFSHQNNWYSTSKAGINYGIGYKF